MSRHAKVPVVGRTAVYAVSRGANVWLSRLYVERPVFHAMGGRRTGPGYWASLTACGIVLWSSRRALGDVNPGATEVRDRGGHMVPVKHAVLFGRPCARCYP